MHEPYFIDASSNHYDRFGYVHDAYPVDPDNEYPDCEEPLADWELALLRGGYPNAYAVVEEAPVVPQIDDTPNGLDVHDMANLGTLLRTLDKSGAVFAGVLTTVSQERNIEVLVWHDSEVHRMEVLAS